jgi:L-rhamnonate dehydratase
MRIVDVRTYVAPPPAASWLNQTRVSTPMSIYPKFSEHRASWRGPNTQDVFVEVVSDEGITGLGVTRGGAIVETIIERHLKTLLVGSDPRDVELLWDQMYRATLAYGRKGAPIMAISAVDLALWDLLAKWLGQPIYRVLGGPVRDFLPVYATHPDSYALAREGYVGAKVPMAFGPADGKEGLRKNVEQVTGMREAIGPDIDIMVDCWMSWSVAYTLAFARAVEPCNIRWIEEPLQPDDYDGYAELRRRISGIQIATGEHEYTRYGFRELLVRGCADVLQPDVAWCGGITEIRRVAAMASAYDIPVVPHNGVMQPWATHLMIATPNCPLAEHIIFQAASGAASPSILAGELEPKSGRVRPTDAPGAGVSFNHDEWRRQTESLLAAAQ